MPASTYRIWSWGGAVDGKRGNPFHIGVAAVAKAGEVKNALANEIICGDIGRALRLPIPPGVIVRNDADGLTYHASLNFSTSGHSLPPAIPRDVTRECPDMSCGVILFDLWVLNNDRHEKNMAYRPSEDPAKRELYLFDHGRALMCGDAADWKRRMDRPSNAVLIDGHCLAAELDKMDAFQDWAERIRALPEYVIREAVDDARRLGVTKEDAAMCADFLLKRRRNLLRIVKANRSVFLNVQPTLMSGQK